MKTSISILIFLLILTGCGQDNSDYKTLVFPTGKYTTFTNFELINMAFRLQDEVIAIDNDYNSESKIFQPIGFADIKEYPATTEFLKKTLHEYRILSKHIDITSCDRLTPVYLEYKDRKTTDLISFKTVAECSAKDSLPDIVNELLRLRQKYTR